MEAGVAATVSAADASLGPPQAGEWSRLLGFAAEDPLYLRIVAGPGSLYQLGLAPHVNVVNTGASSVTNEE